ncbi:MAG: amino acid permease, partial [Limosilactobacillus reuteri]|nr:amino acid permease [Limosilactobacillus reuteri]
LKYIRQHPQSRTFKMPGAPFTDYVILVFLFIVLIVLCMEKQTLIALILTLAWFAILAVASLTQKKA